MPYSRPIPHETHGGTREGNVGVPMLLGDGLEPELYYQTFDLSEDEGTLYFIESSVGFGAQKTADQIGAPLEHMVPWKLAQSGLRKIGLGNRAIRKSMNVKKRAGDFRAMRPAARNLYEAMGNTDEEQITSKWLELFTENGALLEASTRLPRISTKDFQELISTALGQKVDVVELERQLRSVHKGPQSQEVEELFHLLGVEMLEGGYEVNDHGVIIDNLHPSESFKLTYALMKAKYEGYWRYRTEGRRSADDKLYMRAEDMPPRFRSSAIVKIEPSPDAVRELDETGSTNGRRQVWLRKPAAGRVVRPTLMWQKLPDGSRAFRFDTDRSLHIDAARKQVFSLNPLLGAAAIASRYGDPEKYAYMLGVIRPYVRNPDGATPMSLAGLWPLVATVDQNAVLDNEYIRTMEKTMDGTYEG